MKEGEKKISKEKKRCDWVMIQYIRKSSVTHPNALFLKFFFFFFTSFCFSYYG